MLLRFVRTALAVLSVLAITFLFIDVTGVAAEYFSWLPRLQLVPALLSGAFVTVLAIAVVTLLCGRIYCSVVCPLGILQDVISRVAALFSSRTKRRIGRFHFRPARSVVRNVLLGLFVVLLLLGLADVWAVTTASLIEPYSAYGRIATSIFGPAVEWFNNSVLAPWAESHDSYAFFRISFYINVSIVVIAAVTLVVVGAFAWIEGRGYCNTVCPVGTVLGYLSRFALLRPVIDTDKCNGCRSCERHCKASCIDSKTHTIDMSRCVDCMDCLTACRQHAISFKLRKKELPAYKVSHDGEIDAKSFSTADGGRRHFLSVVGLASGALVASAATGKLDGGLTAVHPKRPVKRAVKVVPPGAQGHTHVAQHCVGCQLCVQNCPNGVLRASSDLDSFMQPVMDFTDGYCAPQCTVCSEVCPAGVFHPLDEALKSSTKVGGAVVNLDSCISATQGVDCGSCASHCPSEAITMVESDSGRLIPVVDDAACIGCGACEFHCPVGTVDSIKGTSSAIHVEGLETHRTI